MRGLHHGIILATVGTFFAGVAFAEEATLRIDGSNGLIPLAEPLLAEFIKTVPAVRIELGKGMNLSERLAALKEDRIDLALASHGVDLEALYRDGLSARLVAKTAVVFAVHESVGLKSLSAAQIAAIYRGDFSNWKSLGGPDLPIVRLMRPEDEVDTEVARAELPEFKDLDWAKNTIFHEKSGDLAKALAATPGAIGITSLVRVARSPGLRSIALDGVTPDEESIRANRYHLTRGFWLISREGADGNVNAFLRFVGTARAAEVLRENQAIPMTSPEVVP